MTMNSLLYLGFLITAIILSTNGLCPENWRKFRNKCFYVEDTKGFAQENFELCKSMNATMVTIHDEEENEFVKNTLGSVEYTGYLCYWLGGLQVAQKSRAFAWIDGSEFNYTSFGKHDPNNYDDEEDCVMLSMRADDSGTWWDEHCSVPNRQLCQMFDEDEDVFFFTDEFKYHFVELLPKNYLRVFDELNRNKQLFVSMSKKWKKSLQAEEMRVKKLLSHKQKIVAVKLKKTSTATEHFNSHIRQSFADLDTKFEKKIEHHRNHFTSINDTVNEKWDDGIHFLHEFNVTLHSFDVKKFERVEKGINDSINNMTIEARFDLQNISNEVASKKAWFDGHFSRAKNLTVHSNQSYLSTRKEILLIEQESTNSMKQIEDEIHDLDIKTTLACVAIGVVIVMSLLITLDYKKCRKSSDENHTDLNISFESAVPNI